MKYMTEKEKMLAGEIYSAVDIQLLDELAAAREMMTLRAEPTTV